MKLAIRIFALSVVVAGATAATLAPSSAVAIPSHQSASSLLPRPKPDSMPIPVCGGRLCVYANPSSR